MQIGIRGYKRELEQSALNAYVPKDMHSHNKLRKNK